MPITSGDIRLHYSDLFATSGFSDARAGSGECSFGRWASKTEIVGGVINNLFDDVTGDESNDGDTEYRGIFVYNAHATLTLKTAKLWILTENPSGAHIELAIDGTSAVSKTSLVPQMYSGVGMSNEGQVPLSNGSPASLTYGSGTTKGTALTLGDIGPLQVKGVWLKRYVGTSTAGVNNDYATLKVEGDTLQ